MMWIGEAMHGANYGVDSLMPSQHGQESQWMQMSVRQARLGAPSLAAPSYYNGHIHF